MAKWLSIETAPKDGSIVILYCPKGVERQGYDDDGAPITIGYFGKASHTGGPDRWLSVETIMEYHDYGGMTGVSTWTESVEISPTHWLPIPEFPK